MSDYKFVVANGEKLKLKNLVDSSVTTNKNSGGAKRKLCVYTFLAFASLASNYAAANPYGNRRANTVSEMGFILSHTADGLSQGSLQIAAFVGIVFVATALIKGRQARMYGETIGGYVIMAFVGAMLFSVTTLISILNMSAFGTDPSLDLQDILMIR